MYERIAKEIARLRDIADANFKVCSGKKLMKENEQAIANLEDYCSDQNSFVFLISALATLTNDFDPEALSSCLSGKYEHSDGIFLLEKFFEENKLEKGVIIDNLRYIKRLRSTMFPIHKGLSSEFLKLMSKHSFKPPFNWNSVWKACVDMYVESLQELIKQLNDYAYRIEYKEELDKDSLLQSERKGSVVYLNDILYQYRVLVPLNYKYKERTLVDYLTAAVIAYDKGLKSINYALKKYVTPLKDKFREHEEDIHFVSKRRFLNLEKIFLGTKVLLSRDGIGIKNEKDFRRYFDYVKASLIAYRMGVTPDWIIDAYMGHDRFSNR